MLPVKRWHKKREGSSPISHATEKFSIHFAWVFTVVYFKIAHTIMLNSLSLFLHLQCYINYCVKISNDSRKFSKAMMIGIFFFLIKRLLKRFYSLEAYRLHHIYSKSFFNVMKEGNQKRRRKKNPPFFGSELVSKHPRGQITFMALLQGNMCKKYDL